MITLTADAAAADLLADMRLLLAHHDGADRSCRTWTSS